ncbi:hypothetical protein [Paraburkholderia sp. GAS42]|uniref:hypothetical protein n=1 Tax=Paraburkholderia sp. GAS42 TaxID=3035135 RepID=UPI003D20008C
MKTLGAIAALQALKEQPLWKLLSATKAPVVIASLHSLFLDGETTLSGSVQSAVIPIDYDSETLRLKFTPDMKNDDEADAA